MFCIYCGASNPEGASFCSICGKSIGASANLPVPQEASQQVPESAERSSGNATGQDLPRMSLPTPLPSQPNPQYQAATAGKGKPVLWILAGFAACLLVVITLALVFRLGRSSSQTDAPSANIAAYAPATPAPAPTPAPATYAPPAPVPATDNTPVSAPAQAPPPAPAAPQNPIIGDWQATTIIGSHITLHFGADGKYTLTDISGTEEGVYVFSSGDGTLRLQPNALFTHNIVVWSCQLSGDTFSCTDPNGAGHVYTRIQQ